MHHKPVIAKGDAWRTHGFNAAEAYGGEYEGRYSGPGWAHRNRRLDEPADLLQALPCFSRVRVLRCRAEEVEPIPGAICYIDPDYKGTTCAYGFTLPDPEALALRWAEAGCRVAVSEARPLGLPGWHAHRLPKSSGFGRTWSKQQEEWLTISEPARGQLGLL